MPTTPTPTPRIAIIGAGPGGLTCARILQVHGIPATVHDRASGPDDRNQGGTLDLHPDDGQLALEEAGLMEEFTRLARPEGQEMRQFHAADAAIRFHRRPTEGQFSAPEIDRGQLRDLLLDSLAPGTVRWNHTLNSVEGPADGPRRLHFADGTVVEADLVIGADGAWSKVRRVLSDATPQHIGINYLEARFDDVETRHRAIADLVGQGSAMAADGERCLFAQRNSGGHIRVYIIVADSADWLARAGLTGQDTEGIRALLLNRYRDWAPGLLRLIAENDGPYIDRPLYALPVPHTWETNPTVTLLGDAAHLMPPLGVGVNLAMLDAAELALAVVGHDSIADAIRAYEKTMLPRSNEMQTLLDGAAAGLLADETFDPGHADAH
ncbi:MULTISPECIES: FAD-dependent oxidoreductase [unclassified Streptomyces]|uniref:FAD-dependent oxidoreductase n=1 Tax=unclassified Streptomyces TaxID=2593676 RepID=UPI00081F7433|nr:MULTISPECIES: NAD(P)/FAD-dependent oxidoreductase [unclassified Streptomyces]MYR94084.1 FAD-dependent monooxygenase [Streptomyces sp. SID4937]SCD64921.1 2-polyprenyl-6-methoxyphenol hydroxylase [Streptomyces sp. ScaeMP-e83]